MNFSLLEVKKAFLVKMEAINMMPSLKDSIDTALALSMDLYRRAADVNDSLSDEASISATKDNL